VISHPLPAVALIGDMAAAQAGDPGSPVARGPFTTWGGRLPGGRVSVKDLARGPRWRGSPATRCPPAGDGRNDRHAVPGCARCAPPRRCRHQCRQSPPCLRDGLFHFCHRRAQTDEQGACHQRMADVGSRDESHGEAGLGHQMGCHQRPY